MPVEVMITFFGGLFAIGGILLAGQWMHHQYAGRRSQDRVDRLVEEMDGLREGFELMQERLAGLEARVGSAGGRVALPHDGEGAGQVLLPERGRAVAEPRPPR